MPASRFLFTFGSMFVVLGSGFVPLAQTTNAELVARVGSYVERYYERAQTLLATETIVVQPLAREMADEAYAWRIVNEVRLEPDPADATQLTTIRQMLKAVRPMLGSAEYGDCLDGRLSSPDPLAFLLPGQQRRFRFTVGPAEIVDGVQLQRVDYTPLARQAVLVDWNGKCGNIRAPGSTRGSIWVDGSGRVIRLDARLVEPVRIPGPTGPDRRAAPRSFTLERHDTRIDYAQVTFTDPDEAILLPRRIESIQIVRNTGTPEVRVTRTFSNYRRFLTGGRAIID